jgi:hypothetical protein
MKHTHIIPSLLVSLLLVSSAMAQTSEQRTTSDPQDAEAIAAARIPYTENEGVSHNAKNFGATDKDLNDPDATGETLAQLPRRAPGRPYPRRPGYPRRGSPVMEQPLFNAHHAAIGVVIGFGLGAALGAKANSDQHVQARVAAPLIFGSLGALMGAVIGGSAPAGPRRFHGRRPWPYGDEDESGSRSGARPADQQATSQPAPTKPPAKKEAASLVSPLRPEIGRFVEAENLNASEPHLNY